MRTRDSELEYEFEQELEGEEELEYEGEEELEYEGEEELEGEGEEEQLFRSIAQGIGGLFGAGAGEFEEEGQYEGELESEFESEFEEEGESEYELEGEYEGEFEGEEEYEAEGEEFFRRIGGFLRRAAPVLRQVARVAAPIIGTAVAGPAGGMIARGLTQALGESEFEGEYELEAPGRARAAAEMMAAAAAQTSREAEAEAFIGAASIQVLSARDRRALLNLLPHLVHGAAVLTRVLRRRRITRPAVRVVPTIVQRTASTLVRRSQAGQPVTRRVAGQVMARQTRQVLGDPRLVGRALSRNVRATRTVARPARPRAGGRTAGLGRPRRMPSGGIPRSRSVVVARTPTGRLVPARVVPVRGARSAVPRSPAVAGNRRNLR